MDDDNLLKDEDSSDKERSSSDKDEVLIDAILFFLLMKIYIGSS